MGEEKRRMPKKWEKLTFQFGALFLCFALITILLSAFLAHTKIRDLVIDQSKDTVRGVAQNLAGIITREGDLFKSWQKYMEENYEDLHIEYDCLSFEEYSDIFDHDFEAQYPGKVFGKDVSFDELTDELKAEFATYYQIYWMTIFSNTRTSFNLPFAYYVTIDEPTVTYVVDADRFRDHGDPERLLLMDTDERSREDVPVMYECLDRKSEIDKLETITDEYGYTCTYYVPIIIDGELMGLVGADGDVNLVDAEISLNSFTLVGLLAAVVAICIILLNRFVQKVYVDRLILLNERVEAYTRDKDPSIADDIRANVHRRDEVATLSLQIAQMITELESHIERIVAISGDLLGAQERAAKLDDLARTDAMTGLMNKLSYTECMDRLDRQVKDGTARFSVTMIDLNFLKRLNDTYGHDKGDAAINLLAAYIKKTYPVKSSFRIGGDEFVAVLEGEAVQETDQAIQRLQRLIKEGATDDPATQISAAIGTVTYTNETSSRDVFDKADEEMYRNKKAMKAVRKS